MDDDIPVEAKRAIIAQEMAMWRNTRYQAELRYRVNQRIGADAKTLEAIKADMMRCEAALDALADELAALG